MSIASETLRKAYNLISQPRDFEVGDFVTWKDPCMSNMVYPEVDSLGIVVRFEDPVHGNDNVGSNQYSDLKDMVIGVVDEDGDYSEFMASSRRMKKFVE